MLTCCPPGPLAWKMSLAVVVGLEVDLHVFGLGHHGHRGGGGVDAALGLGLGHALHAMPAALVVQCGDRPLRPPTPRMTSLNPPNSVGFMSRISTFQRLALGVVLVHFVEVAGEQGGLVAAGAGADFRHAAGAIGVLAAGRRVQKLVPQRFPLGLQLGQLGLGQLRAARGRRPAASPLASAIWAFEFLEAAVLRGRLGQRAVLAGDGRHPRRTGQHLGIEQQPFQFLEASEVLFQLIAHLMRTAARLTLVRAPWSPILARKVRDL